MTIEPQTDLTVDDLLAFPGVVVPSAAAFERGLAEGSFARPGVVEFTPWPDRNLNWLTRSLGYLRAIVGMYGRVEDSAPQGSGPSSRD